MARSSVKRPNQGNQSSSKRRKVTTGTSKNPTTKGKERASDKPTIPIPTGLDGDDAPLSDQDFNLLEEYGEAAGFLSTLDHKGIARSKKETLRLHKLKESIRQPAKDDLPDISSHSEDEGEWSSNVGSDDFLEGSSRGSGAESLSEHSDLEMPYETAPRPRQPSWDEDRANEVQRLPIKLLDGRVENVGVKLRGNPQESSDESDDAEAPKEPTPEPREDATLGSRLGRRSVVNVVTTKYRKKRIHAAKEQIASICQEIVGDPEDSLQLLRRLHNFSLESIVSPVESQPVPNDPTIRKLAILSQVAVFKDIIPGYQIRSLTEQEKSEKVGQAVSRLREWEQGLVGVYQRFLQLLETEIKGKTGLADISLKCMCTLLVEATHFNFRTNIISCIMGRLSRRSWDEGSELCHDSLEKVFQGDTTGVVSLEVVRLLNRMIKESKYRVNPNALSCLLHLRLKTEAGVRASHTTAEKQPNKSKGEEKRGKGTAAVKNHLSKKARKVLKEKESIRKEMKAAEVEVNKEERNKIHTETLKLVFVLYFQILKNPYPTPLLPAALQGIAKFAHLVSVDFFRDLLKAIKAIMTYVGSADAEGSLSSATPVYHRLLCISTAFELLSGQGEALNVDLNEFVNHLYAIIPFLGISSEAGDTGGDTFAKVRHAGKLTANASDWTAQAQMLFHVLHLIFTRNTAGGPPAWRTAAFAKRLLTAALHWDAETATRTVQFVTGLVRTNPKLEALLTTEDRSFDGVFQAEIDDPQLCHPFGTSFFELILLEKSHVDQGVRDAARALASNLSR